MVALMANEALKASYLFVTFVNEQIVILVRECMRCLVVPKCIKIANSSLVTLDSNFMDLIDQ